MERFAYLIGNLLLLPLILVFFWKRPDLRQKMITMGLFASLLGPISEIWFLKDYWKPQYALGWPWIFEDFLFGFICGSGVSVVFQILFKKTLGPKMYRPRNEYLLSFIIFGIFTMTIPTSIFEINSIFASMLTLLMSTAVIVILRRDLLPISAATGFLAGLFAFLFDFLVLNPFPDILSNFWVLFGDSLGKTLLGVPLTEIFWAISWGLFAGIFYEFWQGYTAVPLKSSKKVTKS